MENNLQKIITNYNTSFEVARKYYLIICELNNLKITHKELDLIAFSAIHGSISSPTVKEAFIKEFAVPEASVYNMICKLKKIKIFYKDEEKKIRLNPAILPDFTKDNLILIIKLTTGGN